VIKSNVKIPDQVAIAVSGGPDSMAILDFLRRGPKEIQVLHFNHGTDHSFEAEEIVRDYCDRWKIDLKVGNLTEKVTKGSSLEEFWRKNRYNFFERSTKRPVITCHHLDDVVENWVFTSLNGNPMMIPSKRGKYIRPFLVTTKKDLLSWCDRKNVPYIIDPSNSDTSFMRNLIRHELIPVALKVNPGLSKVIRKKVLNLPTIYQ